MFVLTQEKKERRDSANLSVPSAQTLPAISGRRNSAVLKLDAEGNISADDPMKASTWKLKK